MEVIPRDIIIRCMKNWIIWETNKDKWNKKTTTIIIEETTQIKPRIGTRCMAIQQATTVPEELQLKSSSAMSQREKQQAEKIQSRHRRYSSYDGKGAQD